MAESKQKAQAAEELKKKSTTGKTTATKKVAKKRAAAKKKAVRKKTTVKKQAAVKKRSPARRRSDVTIDQRDRYEMIAKMAYFRAERRGFEPGWEQEDWLESEKLVDEMLSKV